LCATDPGTLRYNKVTRASSRGLVPVPDATPRSTRSTAGGAHRSGAKPVLRLTEVEVEARATMGKKLPAGGR
jgi:hypothetical protein